LSANTAAELVLLFSAQGRRGLDALFSVWEAMQGG
jgi:hypothetical protein